jgi:hypothetical protein
VGIADRFHDLAIHLVGISELGAAVMRSPAVTGGPRAGDGGGPAGGWRQWLAGAAASDPDVLAGALGPVAANIDLSGLDIRTHALVRLAALVAAGEPGDPIRSACAAALDRGLTGAETTGVLVALLPVLGADPIAARPPCWAVSEPGPQRPPRRVSAPFGVFAEALSAGDGPSLPAEPPPPPFTASPVSAAP